MAYERYITKSGKLMIAIRVYHTAVKNPSGEGYVSSPTSVELLNVEKEEVKEIKKIDFDLAVSDGRLKRVG